MYADLGRVAEMHNGEFLNSCRICPRNRLSTSDDLHLLRAYFVCIFELSILKAMSLCRSYFH
jgi:hypothetical protein